MSRLLPSQLIAESERANCVRFVAGFALLIVAWAIVHDLNLMRIEPRHFTEFHRQILPLSSHTLLAIQYAVVATLGPGLVFGGIAFVLCRIGRRPPITFRKACLAFLPFLAFVEAASLFAGSLSQQRFLADGTFLFPQSLYPETTSGILFTQSANITAYLAALAATILFFLLLLLTRYVAAKSGGAKANG